MRAPGKAQRFDSRQRLSYDGNGTKFCGLKIGAEGQGLSEPRRYGRSLNL